MAVTIKKPKLARAVGNTVAGFDVSTRTGVVVFGQGGDLLTANEIELEPLAKGSGAGPRIHRALKLGTQAYDLFVNMAVKLVAIEGYSHSPFGMAVAVELGTAVRFAAFRAGVPFVEVSPSTLKKFATGVGKGDKSVVRLGVFKRWGFEHASDNVVDAYVLARIALGMTGMTVGATAHADREVLGALKWSLPMQVIAP